MKILNNSLLLGLLLSLVACTQNATQQVLVEERTTQKGALYSVFYPQDLAIQVVTIRPNAEDEKCALSVAAAYTDLETNQPLGLLVASGRLRQAKATVGFLDGVLTIIDNRLTINKIAKGQSPPSAQLARVQSQHGTLLLQELLVLDGKNQQPAGGSRFQRRALVDFADHRFAVVESAADTTEMQQFGNDLVELGAKNALYLDMGDWDAGWYKRGGQVVELGHRRTETARQSNWLVFAQPSSSPK
ncbi:hypothetical protein QMK33_14820 [Hymenobacter sp. H14-R3]|uniref:hypothetical protein n=1 Tax=Hymenobacter sp. H14-R3 TaxID=3046308 RepID=UPI0024BA331E|nr:hypothetical protein [Hymenobacter sp. H14-R3]MDJ0366429.1 hypothetical protein [Hymenobacter sp. H14-R3]